jgi:hypothetical protein
MVRRASGHCRYCPLPGPSAFWKISAQTGARLRGSFENAIAMRKLPLDAMTDRNSTRSSRPPPDLDRVDGCAAGIPRGLARAVPGAGSCAQRRDQSTPHAAPAPLPERSQWPSLRAADEFRQVRFAATYESCLDATVDSSGLAERADISDPGTWAFIPRDQYSPTA